MSFSMSIMKLIGKYAKTALKKKGIKETVYEGIDWASDRDDFVAKHVFGVNTMDGQKKVDNEFTHYIINTMAEEAMHKDVEEWNEDDYQFVRLTDDYDDNIVKRRKVLNYLQIKNKR